MAPELGLWWPMSPWLSPGAAWFVFFNVLVGAIALMSSRGAGRGQDDEGPRRPVRTASTVVLESLRSVSIFSFHPTTADHGVAASSAPAASQLHHVQVQEQYYTFQEQEAPAVNSRVELQPASVAEEETLAAATTTTAASPKSAPVAAAPAALDASATACEREAEDEESISMDEAYALARATRQPAADTAAAPRKVQGRGGACGRGRGAEEAEGKAQVDARAEQFIRQFREGLKLERINSILNYTHALRRTAGAR